MDRLFLLLLCWSASGATLYVREGAGGSGTDWSDAYSELTSAEASASRGDTIYVADGAYSNVTLNVANDGDTVITVRKATVGSHGTDTGWDDSYGDGQASVSILLGSDNWVVDGATRNESDWSDHASYGFRVTGFTASTAQTPGICASNVTLRYAYGGGVDGTTYTGSEPDNAVYVGGFDEFALGWLLEQCLFQNIAHAAHLHLNGVDGIVIQSNRFEYGWGKESIRGQIACKNAIIRWNQFLNACGHSGEEGEGCTAPIALWDGSANQFDGNEIYGNWIFNTWNDAFSGGAIVVGGDNGVSWAGSPANDVLIYNNTIVGVADGVSHILINGGTGNEVRNTLWYDCVGTPSANPDTSSNQEEANDPFVDYVNFDFHLQAGIPGTALGEPYETDMDGVIRGSDGEWDIGSFEFAVGSLMTGDLRITGDVRLEMP